MCGSMQSIDATPYADQEVLAIVLYKRISSRRRGARCNS